MESRLRASLEQFTLLLEFMERHGDLSRPVPGLQGRQRSEQLWLELANLLNSVGGSAVSKTADKWKRVWSDWKTKTKKKGALINKDIHGTGGGPSKGKPLNPLEERILRLMGVASITGQECIEEAGFEVPPQSHPQSTRVERVPSPVDEIELVSSSPAPASTAAPQAPDIAVAGPSHVQARVFMSTPPALTTPLADASISRIAQEGRSPASSMSTPRRARPRDSSADTDRGHLIGPLVNLWLLKEVGCV